MSEGRYSLILPEVFRQSIEDITITRQARTTDERQETGQTEMGKKSIIPYALYRAEGYVSAALANKTTDLSEADLELLGSNHKYVLRMIIVLQEERCVCESCVFKHSNVLEIVRHI